jgi:hypothetical protein
MARNRAIQIALTNDEYNIITAKQKEYIAKYDKLISRPEALRILAFGSEDSRKESKNVSIPSDNTIAALDVSQKPEPPSDKVIKEDEQPPEKESKDGWGDLNLEF